MHPDRSTGAILVLGASRGLGRAAAIAAAEAGFPVMLGCRTLYDGEVIAAQLKARNLRAIAVQVDVTQYAEVQAAVAHATDFGTGLAGVVNNAGVIGPLASLDAAEPSAWARTIEVNLIGALHGVHAALPVLRSNGVIVNVSSGAAQSPVEGWSAYCASKAALAMLTRSTFLEHGDRIRVYGAQPGIVDTDMQAQIRASGIGPASRVPVRNLNIASLPARSIAWLLRHRPPDLSGTEVELDSVALLLRIGRQADQRFAQ